MKTETLLEECILLAHRINKLGGCVFIEDNAHVDTIEFHISKSKKQFLEREKHEYHYNETEYWQETINLEELHQILSDKFETIQEESNE